MGVIGKLLRMLTLKTRRSLAFDSERAYRDTDAMPGVAPGYPAVAPHHQPFPSWNDKQLWTSQFLLWTQALMPDHG
jgi:hypothetical protein